MLKIVQRFQEAMRLKGYSAVIAVGSSNVFYLSEIPVPPTSVNPVFGALSTPTVVLIPAAGNRVVFAASSLKQYFDDKKYSGELYFYPSTLFIEYKPGISRPEIYAENLAACIARYIKEHPIKDGKVGIDSALLVSPLLNCLEGVVYELADPFILRQRLIKTGEEINRMRIAANASYSGMERVEELLNTGGKFSEIELFYEARKVILNHHCQWQFTSVMAGPFSADIYHQPTDYIIQDGDFVRMDFGAVYEGYSSDVARTIAVGTPKPEYVRMANVLREAVNLIIDALKPGVFLGDTFNLGQNYIRKHGYPQYNRHMLGHSIGIEVEEQPFIESNNDFIVEPNMVFSVETPYYIKDLVGYSHEDMVLVGESGAELLR